MNASLRDGRWWPIGTAAEVAWINAGTSIGLAITSAIPGDFDSYATVTLPETPGEQQRHELDVIEVLGRHSADQPWWLGYLDTGSADIVFPEAPRVRLYADWMYVLVQAGAEQATSWRVPDDFGAGRWALGIPDLLFPVDRSWLVSTLWDDDWTCVGGSVSLIEGLADHPELGPRVRRVGLDEDATPPGHRAI